jgi:hypothetical protein
VRPLTDGSRDHTEAELRQHSRDEIALLERARALEQLAPPTWDKVEAPIPSAPPPLPTITDPATAAREALERFRKFRDQP